MKNEKKEIKYFSMFTGVGGFELGLERANNDKFNPRTQDDNERDKSNTTPSDGGGRGTYTNGGKFKCIGFSEIDKYANELLKNKWPDIKNYGDATKINPKELPDFNLLVGGFPCQAFSIAGKRKGFEDTRGTLFHEIIRILKVKRPEHLLLENVKGLLSHDRGRTFAIILASLSKLGYVIQWVVLNSKFFGVPQNRERVFIIGSLAGESIPEILPFRESYKNINQRDGERENTTSSTITIGFAKHSRRGTHLQQIIPGGQGNRVYSPEGTSTTIASQAGGRGAKTGLYAVLTPDRPEKRQNGRRFKKEGEPSFTLTGQDIHGVAIMDLYNKKEHTDRSPTLTEPPHNTLRVREGMKIRRLTPVECERLQGFPDNWTEGFSDTQRYKMMGNAVTVNVIKAIGERLFSK